MEENKNTTPPAYTPPAYTPPAYKPPVQTPPAQTTPPQPLLSAQPPKPAEPPKCVNKGKPVWFSYAPNSDENPEWSHIADCVEQLTDIFKAQNIEYCINETWGSSASISEYEKNIGWKSDVIVLVFSDRYFRSLHCMYEFVQIKKAIKQYPQKRLYCIKSGDFDLSDINYILDLEHFWGDQKQEYDEVSFHKTRPITNAEEEAHGNGFYMADVRSLYSFFSTLNYANAHSQDWNEFAKDIAESYTSASKFSQLVQEKVKKRKSSLKFMGLGCLSWLLVPILAIIGGFIIFMIYSKTIEEPNYTQGLDYMTITQIDYGFSSTKLYITLANPYDKDTIVYASRGFYIEANGTQYHLDNTGETIPLYPDYTVLHAHDTIQYILHFDEIQEKSESIDFIMNNGIGIYGIQLK